MVAIDLRDAEAATQFQDLGFGGEGEIRTRGWIAPTPVFKTGALNRSATSPFFSLATRARAYWEPARRILESPGDLAFPCAVTRGATAAQSFSIQTFPNSSSNVSSGFKVKR